MEQVPTDTVRFSAPKEQEDVTAVELLEIMDAEFIQTDGPWTEPKKWWQFWK